MTTKLPRHYYSASNPDGLVTTSRFGANSDKAAMRKLARMARGWPDANNMTLFRHEDNGGRTVYVAIS